MKNLYRYKTILKITKRLFSNTARVLINFKMGQWSVPFTFADCFEELVSKYPKNEALYFEDQVYTFEQLNQQVNMISEWALNQANLKKGEAVALFMKNRPEYIFTWLAMCKIGSSFTHSLFFF